MATAEQVRIPDCSNYQGLVDWAAVVRSGCAGGLVKATEGSAYVDPQFIRNWSTLKDLGARRGAYHFARPAGSSATVQAQRFVAIVAEWRPGDLLILDLEVGDGDLSPWALEWLGQVQKLTGLTPWLYSYGPFIHGHLGAKELAAFPLWLAAYQSTPPPAPAPWTSYRLWQHTDKARIPGIIGPCDESLGILDGPPAPTQAVKAMYDPPIGPIAAVWQQPNGDVVAGISPDGDVYAWGCKWQGNTHGKPYWGTRKAAAIGPRDDAAEGYMVTSTDGSKYRLPDGIDKL